MKIDFTKQEIASLKKHGYEVKDIKNCSDLTSESIEIDDLIIISKGNKVLHDSGFPFIWVIGRSKEGWINLGWHDHFVANVSINVDSLGKNIFHIMLWAENTKRMYIKKGYISCSSFQIGSFYPKEDEGVELR